MISELPNDRQTELLEWAKVVEDAARTASCEAVRRHKLLGESIVVWRHGRAESVAAKDIPWEWTGVSGPPE